MAADNRRAEGRRPPHRGRSDRESNPVLGETQDETAQRPSTRESCDRERRRGRPDLPLAGQKET
jgi:hypothetical protein